MEVNPKGIAVFGLDGMVLAFFIAACMVLCLVIVTKEVGQCFSCC